MALKKFCGNASELFLPRTVHLQKRSDYMAQIMTTGEMSKYLKLHAITICKLSKEGVIPSFKIGKVWRFDKEAVDQWLAKG